MKKLLAILIFISALNCFSQNAISPRIGNEIDKYEREYFGLFPSLKFFISASLFATTDSTILLSIRQSKPSNYPDTVIVIPKKVADNLAQYIENFEYYRYPESNVNWSKLGKLAIISNAHLSYAKKVKPLRIVAKDNRFYDGIILYVNDNLLVIQDGGTEFNWEKVKTNTYILKISQINYLTIKNYPNYLLGSALGAVALSFLTALSSNSDKPDVKQEYRIGGAALLGGFIGLLLSSLGENDTNYYINGNPYNNLDELNTIKKHTVFEDALPPELNTLLQNNSK